jgi:1-deoxy-D-xylulose-5-phosphate reductoisomerase
MRLDFAKMTHLTFSLPNRKKFPCLDIAYQAAKRAGSAPCVLGAADEVAVGAYLDDLIGFKEIPDVIEKVLSNHRHVENPDLLQIQSIHLWAVEETKKLCQAR